MEAVHTLRSPFNKAQLELLKLFSRVSNEDELNEIREMISQYYAKKVTEEANRLWDERGYTQETMEQWLNEKTWHADCH